MTTDHVNALISCNPEAREVKGRMFQNVGSLVTSPAFLAGKFP